MDRHDRLEHSFSPDHAHHAAGKPSAADVLQLSAIIADWKALLASALSDEELKDLRGHSRTGRPLGDETFVERLESAVGRALKPQKRGPKPKQKT
ncbi:MAG: hypothetical protein ACLQNE_05815 [Thermoguttaceae bacterium]